MTILKFKSWIDSNPYPLQSLRSSIFWKFVSSLKKKRYSISSYWPGGRCKVTLEINNWCKKYHLPVLCIGLTVLKLVMITGQLWKALNYLAILTTMTGFGEELRQRGSRKNPKRHRNRSILTRFLRLWCPLYSTTQRYHVFFANLSHSFSIFKSLLLMYLYSW